MYKPDIQLTFFPKDSVSPGGLAAIAISIDGQLVRSCIGSGENFRDAKAYALRNVRNILKILRDMKECELCNGIGTHTEDCPVRIGEDLVKKYFVGDTE